MRQLSIKIIILLQVVLYLLGGHATAHGLAWCISADGHAHVETAAGCVTEQKELFSPPVDYFASVSDETGHAPHSGVECRHLPVTSPHGTSVVSGHKVESGSIIAVVPTVSAPALRCLTAAVYKQTLYPSPVEIPRPVALVSLRTIVLVI